MNLIKKLLKNIARKILGLELKKLHVQNRVLTEVIGTAYNSLSDGNRSCEAIVFSKDRAIQLHALLSTYFIHVKNPIPITVLYTSSTITHHKSYEELISIFSEKGVRFNKESSFRNDLIKLISEIKSDKIMFMTDDALFVESFDMNEVLKVNPLKAVFQLHRGLDAKYNMHSGNDEVQPGFYSSNEFDADIKLWDFNPGAFSVTYNYPLSLDGTLFNRFEILSIFKNIDFKAPNSLESMMQIYNPVMIKRKGICFTKSKYINVPCNIVNSEINNTFTGFYTIEELLYKWQNGYRIQYEDLFSKDYKDVVTAKFNFITRD